MVGNYLTKMLLQLGHKVIVLTRNPQTAKNPLPGNTQLRFAYWDVAKQEIDSRAIAEADALIHLAGAGVVAKPWTDAYKREILDSRVNGSRLLVRAIEEYGSRLTTVISASAIGWYGEDSPGLLAPFTEEMPVAKGFLGETCRAWEESIRPVEALGKRLVICRIGIVLSNDGGALSEFIKPLNLRIAGILGSGKQVISWIHIYDLCRIFYFALEQEHVTGIFNAVAPQPVSNKQLTITLAQALYGKGFLALPVPSFVLKLMMGERSLEVLKSTSVSSAKLEKEGFRFYFPNIKQAIENLVT